MHSSKSWYHHRRNFCTCKAKLKLRDSASHICQHLSRATRIKWVHRQSPQKEQGMQTVTQEEGNTRTMQMPTIDWRAALWHKRTRAQVERFLRIGLHVSWWLVLPCLSTNNIYWSTFFTLQFIELVLSIFLAPASAQPTFPKTPYQLASLPYCSKVRKLNIWLAHLGLNMCGLSFCVKQCPLLCVLAN